MSQTKAQLVNPLNGDVGNKIVVGSAVTITPDGLDVAAGVITASSFVGSGSGITGVAATANVSTSDLVVAGISTFNDQVSAAQTITIAAGGLNATGGVTAVTGGVTATAGGVTVTAGDVSVGSAATISNTTGNAAFAGIVSATGGFVGDVTGNVSGTAGGLTGSPSITVTNLTVNGTETVINTDELHVSDKTIGIGSTSAPTQNTQDGTGFILFGPTPINFTYDAQAQSVGLNTSLNVAGFSTVGGGISVGGDVNVGSAATIYNTTGNATFSGVTTAISVNSTGAINATTQVNVSTGATVYANGNIAAAGIVTANTGLDTPAITVGTGVTLATNGNVACAGIVTASSVNAATNVPAGQTGSVTLAASDAGKFVAASGGITLPAATFATGDAITIYNNTGGAITLTCSAPAAVYLGTDGSTKTSITLALRCVCTFFCVSGSGNGTFVCTGGGIT